MNIRLAENFRAVFYAPFYATVALGFHRAEGVEITLFDSPSPGAGIAELAAGRIDCMWGGPLRVIRERDDKPRDDGSLLAFCEVAGRDPFCLVGQSGGAFVLRDLQRMRLGSVSEVPTPWLCLEQDLRDLGIDPATIDRIADRTMAANLGALARADLDVAQVFEPYVTFAERQGARVLYAASERGPTAYTTFLSTVASIRTHRQAFEAMIRAVEQFGPWLQAHGPAELARVVASYYPDLAHDVLVSAFTRYRDAGLWTCTRTVSRAGFARLALSMRDSGFVHSQHAYEDCVADFAREP